MAAGRVAHDPGKDKRIPLRPLNVLLRGALLRNTDKIVGVAVYVGKDTKIMRNLRQTRLKFSTLERRVNLFVMGIFIFNMAIWFLSLGLRLLTVPAHSSVLGPPSETLPARCAQLTDTTSAPTSAAARAPLGQRDLAGQVRTRLVVH